MSVLGVLPNIFGAKGGILYVSFARFSFPIFVRHHVTRGSRGNGVV